MSRSLKISLFTVSAVVALLALTVVVLLFIVDINAYKPRLEAAASEALAMEVRVGGQMQVGLFSGLLVTLEDILARFGGNSFALILE